MAEESERDIAKPGSGPDPMAREFAMAAGGEDAREYLREQIELTRLQKENLIELNAFELSHLRWRSFNDRMKGAMQIMLVAVGALIVVAIGAAVWNAGRASGLVVDAFSAPPDFESRGMGGDVIAGDVTDRIAAIRATALGVTFSSSGDVNKDRSKDIKVEIPETGVSISEAWRYLRSWLGHERHLTGSLRELGQGQIALAVSLDGVDTITESGSSSELAKLEQKAAEDVFGEFDPVNHINYFTAQGRFPEAYAAAEHYVTVAQGSAARAHAYELYSFATARTGEIDLAIRRARVGIEIDPQVAAGHYVTMRMDFGLGRFEDALREARAILPLRNEDQPTQHQGAALAKIQTYARGTIALLLGDFANADGRYCAFGCDDSERFLARAALAVSRHDVAGSRLELAEAQAAGPVDPENVAATRYLADLELGVWPAAIADATSARVIARAPQGDMSRRIIDVVAFHDYRPEFAVTEAHAGWFAAAHRDIDATPGDCVPCEAARGDIDAVEKKPAAAAWWYARAIRDAPSVPFAYTKWGAKLMAKGDYDGAIVKFAQANAKGPHFADPLEMWGEALMQENRSDLALTKFEEADKYAPNWGRLHLKWGEALGYVRRTDEARKQFSIAAGLDLSAADKTSLAKWTALHV